MSVLVKMIDISPIDKKMKNNRYTKSTPALEVCDDNQIEGLREVFNELDQTKTGMINTQDLRSVLNKNGYDVDKEEVEAIIANLDSTGNGKINYTEFLIATMEVKRYMSPEMMQALFRYFDTDHSGLITPQDLRMAFGKTGKRIREMEIQNLMKMYAGNKEDSRNMSRQTSQGITFDKFKKVLMEEHDEDDLVILIDYFNFCLG